MFWKSSSYHWDVIGWASDLGSITREQADAYFDTYYAPNNLTMILVGDLDPDETIKLVKKYFERIPRGKTDAAGCRDPRREAARREAADRRGRDRAPRPRSGTTPWPGSTPTATRSKCWPAS